MQRPLALSTPRAEPAAAEPRERAGRWRPRPDIKRGQRRRLPGAAGEQGEERGAGRGARGPWERRARAGTARGPPGSRPGDGGGRRAPGAAGEGQKGDPPSRLGGHIEKAEGAGGDAVAARHRRRSGGREGGGALAVSPGVAARLGGRGGAARMRAGPGTGRRPRRWR